MPALIIWGARGRLPPPGLAHEALARCDQGRLEFIEEATHWVQHEEPERVNRLLVGFLDEGEPEEVARDPSRAARP